MYRPSGEHITKFSQRIFGSGVNKKATVCVRFESSDDPDDWEDEWKRRLEGQPGPFPSRE